MHLVGSVGVPRCKWTAAYLKQDGLSSPHFTFRTLGNRCESQRDILDFVEAAYLHVLHPALVRDLLTSTMDSPLAGMMSTLRLSS